MKKSDDNLYQTSSYSESRKSEISDEISIDIRNVFGLFRKHIIAIVFTCILCGAAAGLYSYFFISRSYEASGTIFLTPMVNEGEIDLNSLNSNQKLVTNVMNLITQDNILETVAQENGFISAEDIKDVIHVQNTPNTELITVSAVTGDAHLSKNIVEDTLNTFISMMKDSLNVRNIQITNSPKLDFRPVGPKIFRNTLIGGLAGLMISVLIILIRAAGNKKLKDKKETEDFLGLPVFAQLPDLEKKRGWNN